MSTLAVLLACGCESRAWLGDWPQVGGGAAAGTGGGAGSGGGAATGGGSGGSLTRDQVCMQALFGCQWSEPSQSDFLKPTTLGRVGYGAAVQLSADGKTLVVGAQFEAQSGVGVNPMLTSTQRPDSGAAFIYRRLATGWTLDSYLKASNSTSWTQFGASVAISGDGLTVAVAATQESSGATGIDGDQTSTSERHSGAVYVFVRGAGGWVQQAYVKASNTHSEDGFGVSLTLSGDGNVLVVGAPYENGAARPGSGAAYVFLRSGAQWQQAAYLKAGTPVENGGFGAAVAVSADGATLVVSGVGEPAVYPFVRSSSTFTAAGRLTPRLPSGNLFGASVAASADGSLLAVGSQNGGDIREDTGRLGSGEVELFSRQGIQWSRTGYLAATPYGMNDHFGSTVAMSQAGDLLLIGAPDEDSSGIGPNSDPTSEGADAAGAAYVFAKNGSSWTQMAYLKATNPRQEASYGQALAIAGDGSVMAVATWEESTGTTGIDAPQTPSSNDPVGAVYLLVPR
jgi:hypothetical protein